MLVIAISQEPIEYDVNGEHEGEYYVTLKYNGKKYIKYYTYCPEFEDVKSDFEVFPYDFELIE